MSASTQTIAPVTPPPAPASRPERTEGPRLRLSPWHAALAAVLVLSAVLNFRRLGQNGYANIFYSAGVKSELASWHNFLFVSFDPHGFISIDKPPIALWVQVVSAELFGFRPLSLLAPEALAGVLSVLVLYLVVAPRFGRAAGVASALALAVFPSFVAVSRDNGPDAVLILLLLCACAVGLTAVETGRWRSLLGGAVLVGLAFNTKTLAALVIVPGLGLAYLACAPGSLQRRLGQLLAAGTVLVVVSGAWIAYVDLTPASQRPYVGSSANNSEVNLTFSYNGLGRVGGQSGGPGQVAHLGLGSSLPPAPVSASVASASSTIRSVENAVRRANGGVHGVAGPPPLPPTLAERLAALRGARANALALARAQTTARLSPGVLPIPRIGHAREPSPFGGPTGPLRLFSLSLGGQDGWYLPFALVGFLAIALLRPRRRDPRLATFIVLGGWFACEVLLLSFSSGIVHPYYVSALGPPAAAMVGIGATVLGGYARRVDWRLMLIPIAAAATIAVESMLLAREHYLHPFVPVLVVGAAAAVIVALLARRVAGAAIAVLLGLCLIAPAAYASTVWEVPTDGTFPVAGPHAAHGVGGFGTSRTTLLTDRRLIAWVHAHSPGIRWGVLTVASDTAAPLILMNFNATALAGYSGTDQALDGRGLARWVAAGQARYVMLGGAYSTRGGDSATQAARFACRLVPSLVWRGLRGGGTYGLELYDCRGRAAQLAAYG